MLVERGAGVRTVAGDELATEPEAGEAAADGYKHVGVLRGVLAEGDLAVIEVSGADLEPATFADSSRVAVGEIALAIGNPLGCARA